MYIGVVNVDMCILNKILVIYRLNIFIFRYYMKYFNRNLVVVS